MKKIQFIIFLGLVSMLCQVQGQDNKYETATAEMRTSKSKLQWETRRINVGAIAQNNPIEVEFKFTNEGAAPIIINKVKTSCGCTAAKHSLAPIMPGESSKILVTYDARKPGFFNKSITIEASNDENPTLLLLAGTVQ